MVKESPIIRNECVTIHRIEIRKITLEVLSPTQEWALFGLESLWPHFFFLDTVLLEDFCRGVTLIVVVCASWSLFFRRSLFFGASETSITSIALDEAPSYENVRG